MPRYSGTRFLQPFAKCLASLPNLRCLRILHCSMTAKELQAAFRRQRYLQVLTLVIPADAWPLLQAFPQITELVVNRFSSKHGYAPHIALLDTYNLHEAITTHCHCLKLLSTDILTPNYIEHMQLVHGVYSLDRIQSSSISNFKQHMS